MSGAHSALGAEGFRVSNKPMLPLLTKRYKMICFCLKGPLNGGVLASTGLAGELRSMSGVVT
jgi:hypothetical protein